jgi:hypothetical protein
MLWQSSLQLQRSIACLLQAAGRFEELDKLLIVGHAFRERLCVSIPLYGPKAIPVVDLWSALAPLCAAANFMSEQTECCRLEGCASWEDCGSARLVICLA